MKKNWGVELLKGALAIVLAALMLLPPVSATAQTVQKTYTDATGAFLNETAFVNGTVTTSSSSVTPVDLGAYASGVIVINVTAASGTSPSLTVNFQTCASTPGAGTAPANANCTTHTAGSAITATGLQIIKVDHFARWNTVNYTISGTTPSFTVTVTGYFKPTS